MNKPVHDVKNPAFLSGGGEMNALMRAHDWGATPLGPPEAWPQSLKTAVGIMLTSRQPIWIGWGKELIYLYNDPYKSIIGGKHPRALGRPTSEVWSEIWPDIGPMLATAMSGSEGTYVEEQLLIMERNGYPEETYYTFSYSPIPGDDGRPGGIICANTDDTQRVIGERQLALLRELAARTLDASNWQQVCERGTAALASNRHDLPFALIYMQERDARTLSLAAACGIEAGHAAAPASVALDEPSPWPFAEALGRTEPHLVTDLAARFPGGLPSGAWHQAPVQAALLSILPAGEAGLTGVLVVGLNPFRLFDDDYRGFLGLVAGQIGAAIAHAEAYEEERRRAEKLAEIDHAKTLFFSNVSHEFRTPLTLILAPLEESLAQGERLPVDERERVTLAHRNGVRLLKLVNSLLEFSRIEAGRAQANFEPTDLAALTADLASNFRSATERAGLRLVVDCPQLPHPVHVDRDMWEKIVLNLLSNAFKFTFEGEIVVELKESGDAVELAVRDTGTGLPADELPRMFERFHRIEGAQGRSFEGSGIGLALVQELVKLHGGTIRVESEEGRGTTFTISVPLGTAHLAQDRIRGERKLASTAVQASVYVDEALRWLPDAKPARPAVVATGAAPETRTSEPSERACILLADDNADMRDYLSRLLGSRHDVQAVANGQDALEAIRARRPDLVLSDVMMPRLDGFGLVAALRANPDSRDLPVILLSARAGEEAQAEGRASGADDYLTKPFSAPELLARVDGQLKLAKLRHDATAELQASERRLRALVEASSDVIYRMSPDWSEMHQLVGRGFLADTADPSSIWLDKYIHPDDQPRVKAVINTAIRNKTMFEMEHRVVRADGSLGWTLSRSVPLLDERGEITEWFGTASDITERKRMEALRTAQNRVLEQAIQNTPLHESLDVLVRMVEEQSPRGMLGSILLLERDGSHLRHAAAPSLPDTYKQAIDGIACGPDVCSCGSDACGKSPVYVSDIATAPQWTDHRDVALSHGLRSFWSTPIFSGHGQVLGTFAAYYREPRNPAREDQELVDFATRSASLVIEHKRAEEALRELNATLEQRVEERTQERDRIWRIGKDMLGIADANGVWLSINPAWTATLGWSEAEIVGRTSEWLEHPEDREKTRAEIAQLVQGAHTHGFENRFRTRGGSWRWLSWTAVREGDLLYCGARDITAEKNQADALRQTEEQLRQAQKMEAVGKLTGGIAHDFNNLLQVIGGNLQLLTKDVAGDDRAEQRLRNAFAGVARGSKLASQLLAFGRRQPLAPKVVNLGRLIRSMDDMLRRALGEGIEIDTIIAGGLWNTFIDIAQVENAILNLAINARDAMREHGKLTIEAGNASLDEDYAARHAGVTTGQYVMLAITDTGCGIPPDIIERVFEPFFTTKPEGQGTGLGLSMVYGLVKQSGGHIKLYSEPGQGTTVRIYLPRVQQQEDAPVDIEMGTVVGGTETVLVVEDDEDVRATAVETLSDLGYRVLKARDADSALVIIESGIAIDLLFTDVVMPGKLRSPELARKARERLPNIAVLFTSGYTQNAIVHGGRLDEGVELLSKPYTREKLAQKIRHVLRSQRQRGTPATAVPARGGDGATDHSAVGGMCILLVEDEVLIRSATAAMLESLGHLVVQAETVADAKRVLGTQTFDVLLTDMKLPDGSGRELAAEARRDCPGLQVIFASGYDLAREQSAEHPITNAIHLQKPYNSAHLMQALAKTMQ